jgi:RNA polymerase primary sigma factor
MTRLRPQSDSPAQSPLASYLREINEAPLLTAAEEKALAYRIEEGDSEARERLVRANLRLVVSLARAYVGKGLDLPDLIEEGNLGLLRAVEGFDPSMNTRFSTYAAYWIKQSMKRGLINQSRTVRVPSYMAELLIQWRRASARLQEELGRAPTPEEVGRSLKLSRKKLAIIQKALRIYPSAPHSDSAEEGWSLDEQFTDSRTRAPDAALVEADDLRHVLGLLDQLDEREASVLRLRFGLGGEDPKTLKEIGERLGLTRERVRQIEDEALAHLREGLGAAC